MNMPEDRIAGGYYYLGKGDIIQEGDEIDSCNDAWRDDAIWVEAKHCIGEPAPDPRFVSHRQYRRKLTQL